MVLFTTQTIAKGVCTSFRFVVIAVVCLIAYIVANRTSQNIKEYPLNRQQCFVRAAGLATGFRYGFSRHGQGSIGAGTSLAALMGYSGQQAPAGWGFASFGFGFLLVPQQPTSCGVLLQNRAAKGLAFHVQIIWLGHHAFGSYMSLTNLGHEQPGSMVSVSQFAAHTGLNSPNPFTSSELPIGSNWIPYNFIAGHSAAL